MWGFSFLFFSFFLFSFLYRFFFPGWVSAPAVGCLCIMIVYILGTPFNNGGYLVVYFWDQVWDGCGLCFEGYIYPWVGSMLYTLELKVSAFCTRRIGPGVYPRSSHGTALLWLR